MAGLGREIQKIDATIYTGKLEQIILSFFLCSTCTVLVSTSELHVRITFCLTDKFRRETGIILFKVWVTRRHLNSNSLLFAPSLAIFLESGAVYCTLVIVLAALFISQCSPQIVFLDIVST
jgi:hypothetical protein